jgi:PAS domain S-box-containing protein
LPRRASLTSEHELFELIVESSTDFAIFTTDLTGSVTSWNIGAQRLFQFSEREILGDTADLIFTSVDRAKGVPDRERSDAATKGKAIDERWHRRKDDSLFWASGLMMPLRDGNGFVKITRDLTTQHQQTELLKESERRFRLLATSVPQLVFIANARGEWTWASPQWVRYSGLHLETSMGMRWLHAVHPEDREPTQAAWLSAHITGEYRVEHRLRQTDGRYRWHQTLANRLGERLTMAPEWVGTMTEVHNLRGSHDRQKVLLAEMQHRTRNTLAVVQSIANRTIRSSETLDEFRDEFESRLAALSRVQVLVAHGSQQADLRSIIEAELHGLGSEDYRSRTDIDGPEVLLGSVAAQSFALALHELVTNAVKYGALRQPGATLSIKWAFEDRNGETFVILHWRETGVTMTPNHPARKGFGTELIERVLPYQLDAETSLRFEDDGVKCSIRMPASALYEVGPE